MCSGSELAPFSAMSNSVSLLLPTVKPVRAE
jgi:hypothetical protein